MPEKKKVSQPIFQLDPAKVLEIKPDGKYLLILPRDANTERLAPAIAAFFAPTPVFVLAVNEVSDIKIAELLGE